MSYETDIEILKGENKYILMMGTNIFLLSFIDRNFIDSFKIQSLQDERIVFEKFGGERTDLL